MGWLSVAQLLNAVKGERIPDFIDTGVMFVDRVNLDTYKTLMEKEAAAKLQAAPRD
jgi:hypothetical protein